MHTAFHTSERVSRLFPQTRIPALPDKRDLAYANQLLGNFPPESLDRIAPHLRLLEMPRNKVLHESGLPVEHVYFPVTSIISLLYTMENGDSVQTAMVGREGMIGISTFMGGTTSPGCAVIQSAGSVLRLRATVLAEEIERNPQIMRLLLHYTQTLFIELAQSLVCRRHHSVENQFCRWLLIALDRSRGNELFITHELVAGMIGVRREGITEAAVNLQRQGIIRYRRGHITFVDRAALEKRVCECYGAVKQQMQQSQPTLSFAQPGEERPAAFPPGARHPGRYYQAAGTVIPGPEIPETPVEPDLPPPPDVDVPEITPGPIEPDIPMPVPDDVPGDLTPPPEVDDPPPPQITPPPHVPPVMPPPLM